MEGGSDKNEVNVFSDMKKLEKDLLSSTNIESPSKSYKVVPITGKGMGVVALRMIKKGELILKESPLLRFVSSTENDRDIYFNEFKKLSESKLDEILQLDNFPIKDRKNDLKCWKSFEKIIMKYSFDLSQSCPYNPTDVGIFKEINMLNHSCMANAERNFVEPELRIYAIQDISKDTEICIEYYDLILFRELPTIKIVRDFYKSRWDFDCTCELCGNTDIESSSELEKQRILYWQQCKKVDEYRTHPRNSEITLKLCEKLLLLKDKAKRFSVRDVRVFGLIGLKATLDHPKLSLSVRKEKAKYFTQLTEKAISICEGSDQPETGPQITLRLLNSCLDEKYG